MPNLPADAAIRSIETLLYSISNVLYLPVLLGIAALTLYMLVCFGTFGAEWRTPSVFWFVGGTDPDQYAKAKAAGRTADLPTNHSPHFAPVLHPTLQTGVETLVTAAAAWLT